MNLNRATAFLLGPEAVAGLLLGLVWLVVARLDSSSARDQALLEKLVWLLPLAGTVAVFGSLGWTPTRSWGWLARANAALLILVCLGANRLVSGMSASGSGQSGLGMGLLVAVCLGLVLAGPASTVCGAVILADQQPAFAEWFHRRPVLGSFVVLLAAVPVSVVLATVGALLLGLLGGIITSLQR